MYIFTPVTVCQPTYVMGCLDLSIQTFRQNPAVTLRSAGEAQQWFRARGLSIAQWAMEKGFNPTLVYAVLQGRRKCVRGQSFQIAVALRLKEKPADDR